MLHVHILLVCAPPPKGAIKVHMFSTPRVLDISNWSIISLIKPVCRIIAVYYVVVVFMRVIVGEFIEHVMLPNGYWSRFTILHGAEATTGKRLITFPSKTMVSFSIPRYRIQWYRIRYQVVWSHQIDTSSIPVGIEFDTCMHISIIKVSNSIPPSDILYNCYTYHPYNYSV